jgi:hypothetical protein
MFHKPLKSSAIQVTFGQKYAVMPLNGPFHLNRASRFKALLARSFKKSKKYPMNGLGSSDA